MARTIPFQERDLIIKAKAIFKISVQDNSVKAVSINESNEGFNKFLKSIVNEISTETSGRKFDLVSNETEVISIITKIVNEESDMAASQTMANRLLREETKAQQQILQFGNELHGGILILTHIIDRAKEKFIICKADVTSFIDDETYEEKDGYPFKKKIFKSAQIIFDDDKEIIDIIVNDINNTIAKYWWDGFLEVGQKWTDDYNTDKAFKTLDSKIFSKIRRESETDYWNIRNASVKYFRSELEFDIEDYIEKCWGDYQPEKENLDINGYKAKIRTFPDKHQFDAKFTLNRTAITARIKKSIELNDNIELILKGEVEIGTIIKSDTDSENKKGIFIRSDKGYEAFKGG